MFATCCGGNSGAEGDDAEEEDDAMELGVVVKPKRKPLSACWRVEGGRVFERCHAPYGGLVVSPRASSADNNGDEESLTLTVSLTPRDDRRAYRHTLEDAAVSAVLERFRPLGACVAVTRTHLLVNLEDNALPTARDNHPGANTYRDGEEEEEAEEADASESDWLQRQPPSPAATLRMPATARDDWDSLVENSFRGVALLSSPPCIPPQSSVADVAWRTHRHVLVAQAVYGLAALHSVGIVWCRVRPAGAAACYPSLAARTTPSRAVEWRINGAAQWHDACGFDVYLVNFAEASDSLASLPFVVTPEELFGIPVTLRSDEWLLAWSIAAAVTGTSSFADHPDLPPMPVALDTLLAKDETTRRLWSALAERSGQPETTLATVARFAWALVALLGLPTAAQWPEVVSMAPYALLQRVLESDPTLLIARPPAYLQRVRDGLWTATGALAPMLEWDPLKRPPAHALIAQLAAAANNDAILRTETRRELWLSEASGWTLPSPPPPPTPQLPSHHPPVLVRQGRLFPPGAVQPARRFLRLVPRWLVSNVLAESPATAAALTVSSSKTPYCVYCGHTPAPLFARSESSGRKPLPCCSAMCQRALAPRTPMPMAVKTLKK